MAFLLMQLKEDLKKQKEAACFKARPNVVVHQEPFVPKRENKPVSGRVTVLATRAWLITQNWCHEMMLGVADTFTSTASIAVHLIN